jgi:hypothetical protein
MHAPRRAASAIVALAAHPALALAQSSTSFRVNAVVDTGGGTSSSTNHVVTACIGSEIAGSQSSSNFRIDSGCGATVLAVVRPDGGGGSGGAVTPVPTLTDAGIALLVVLMAVAAARKLVRRGA